MPSQINHVQIIYLNGPSSSGKTTLAKMLQDALEEPYLHIGIDKMIGMMPQKVNDWEGRHAPLGFSWKLSEDPHGHPIYDIHLGPFAKKVAKTFRDVVVTMAKQSHRIIIDDVAFGDPQVEPWRACLKDFKVLWVGVKVPLAVLEEREQARTNRIRGSARAQFYKVHRGITYDLEIDTSKHTFEQCVSLIEEHMKNGSDF